MPNQRPKPHHSSALYSSRRSLTFWTRLLKVQVLALQHGVDEVVFALPLLKRLRPLRALLPWRWFRETDHSRHGERLRRFLEAAGPLYVKLGQALSTRSDMIPADVIAELSQLQDNVPAFSGELAQEIIEKTYGKPINEVFAHFDIKPLASASIAQVHCATLHNGEEVVIKLLRPDIEKTIRADLAVLFTLASIAEKHHREAERLRLVEVIAEYEKTILGELDLMSEAANASQIARNFADTHFLRVPEIHWDLVRRNIIVMEKMGGIPVSDIQSMQDAGVDMELLGRRGVEIFFKQVFRDSFFHADMHPGNVRVDISDPSDPIYIALDFGIVGALSDEDQSYLAQNLLAFFNRDYRRVAELHIDSGWVAADTRLVEFETTIRAVCEPVFDKPISEISFGHFLLTLFNTARRFEMYVQPQLVLLQKTLLHIEGLGRLIYPELDLWDTGKPILEKWMRDRMGFNNAWAKMQRNLPQLLHEMPDLPTRAIRLLEQAERGELLTKSDTQQLEDTSIKLKQATKKQQRHGLAKLMLIAIAGYWVVQYLNIELSPMSISISAAALAIWLLR